MDIKQIIRTKKWKFLSKKNVSFLLRLLLKLITEFNYKPANFLCSLYHLMALGVIKTKIFKEPKMNQENM